MEHTHIWRMVWTNGHRWIYTCVARRGRSICYDMGYGVHR